MNLQVTFHGPTILFGVTGGIAAVGAVFAAVEASSTRKPYRLWWLWIVAFTLGLAACFAAGFAGISR